MKIRRWMAAFLAALTLTAALPAGAFASRPAVMRPSANLNTTGSADVLTVSADAAARTYVMTVTGIDAGVTRVQMPVWSDRDGQDDIIWYDAANQGGGTWTAVMDMTSHGAQTGSYTLHVYATKNGSLTFITAGGFFVEELSPGTVSAATVNRNDGLYSLTMPDTISPAGLSSVRMAVWSEDNGQDDLVWYEAERQSGSWTANVDLSNHGYRSGKFIAHVYVTDNRGVQGSVASTSFDAAPMAANVVSAEMDSIQSTATVTIKNTQLPAGATGLQVAAWGSGNGQNDLRWYDAEQVDGRTWQASIPVSNHKESGLYHAHVYTKGVSSLLGAASFNVSGISAHISIPEKDTVNGYFTVRIDDIKAPAGMAEMQVAVWSGKDSQDDLRWYTPVKSGNAYICQVDIADHKMDTGNYYAHLYATDNRGIYGFLGQATVSVSAPTAAPSMKTEVNEGAATVKLTLTNVPGASSVLFPVWGRRNGQNDIVWYEGKQVNSRTWTATVYLGNHKETGTYDAHAYATVNGRQSFAAGTAFDVSKVITNAFAISNVNTVNGNFTASVTNPTGLTGINAVTIAVWSAKDGQDDVRWYDASVSGTTWSVNVDAGDHLYDRGIYVIHYYGYNASGQSIFLGSLTHNVSISAKIGFVKEGDVTYYYTSPNQRAYGFERIGAHRYFFDRTTGIMAQGWTYVDGYKYYFDPETGAMYQDIDAIIGPQSDYYLKINKALNCATLYTWDAATGSYCIPVKSIRVSTGDATPLGVYALNHTYRWLLMVTGTYCQYLTLITGDFLIHSILYDIPDPYTLQAAGYNYLGINQSLGCVRMRAGEAYLIYSLVNQGRLHQVYIYEDPTSYGPYDWPYYGTIPEDQRYDPTDPAIQ